MKNPSTQKPGIVFVARFLAALILFYLVIAYGPVNDRVVVPFTEWIVRATALILRAIQEPVLVAGTEIRTLHFGMDVRNGCNGVEAMMMLAAAMIAFPATLRSRVTGLLVASAAIQVLNLVRVTFLVWVGEHHRSAFDVMHVAVWQTIVIAAAVAMFVFWSVRFAEKPVEARR